MGRRLKQRWSCRSCHASSCDKLFDEFLADANSDHAKRRGDAVVSLSRLCGAITQRSQYAETRKRVAVALLELLEDRPERFVELSREMPRHLEWAVLFCEESLPGQRRNRGCDCFSLRFPSYSYSGSFRYGTPIRCPASQQLLTDRDQPLGCSQVKHTFRNRGAGEDGFSHLILGQ